MTGNDQPMHHPSGKTKARPPSNKKGRKTVTNAGTPKMLSPNGNALGAQTQSEQTVMRQMSLSSTPLEISKTR